MKTAIPNFKQPHVAYEQALSEGRLSRDPADPLFFANFMYMGTWGGVDSFKHRETRRYLRVRES